MLWPPRPSYVCRGIPRSLLDGLEWFVKDAPVQVSPGPEFFVKDRAAPERPPLTNG